MNKQKILIISLIVLLVIFLSYFIYDMLNKQRNILLLEGYTMAVNELISSAENESCDIFSVYAGEKSVNLINVDCLSSNNEEAE